MARNRRKAATKDSSSSALDVKPTKTFTTPEGVKISEIPLSTPAYGTKATGKTLLDIIEEKRPRDEHGNPIGTIPGDDEEEVDFGHGMDTFFFAVPLTILLFWLDVLVHMQYRQEMDWKLIIARCAKGFPAIFAIHYFFHPRRAWVTVRLFLLSMSIAAGCYIVKSVNKHGYYFVMKKTPALGTLWIWAVIELDIVGALLSLVVVGMYTWYYGYSII